MKEAHKLRNVIKPGVVTMTLMLTLVSTIMSISLYVDYQRYLSTFHRAQIREINEVKHKEAVLLKELKTFLRLTQSRIEAIEDNLERLQRIITSLTHVTIHQIPVSFQSAAYHKISKPQFSITRLGISYSKAKTLPLELSSDEKIALWQEQFLVGRLPISTMDSVHGILEVKIDMASLNAYFGPRSKINFFVQEGVIQFNKNAATSFWEFIKENKHRFTIFGGLTFVMLLMLICGIFITSRVDQKRYFQQVQELGDALSISRQQESELKDELTDNAENNQSLQVSRQAHFKLQAAIGVRQKERAKWLTQSLDVIMQHYQNPNVYMSDQDQFDIIRQCQNEALSLSLGVWKSIENENVDLKKTISSTLQLFADKTHKSSISIDMKLPIGPCAIPGDDLLMELLFMNIVGKAIHRVPKNGRISISLTETKNDFCLEVIDNGYTDTSSAEKLIKKSFDLFLSDGNFLHICQENGLNYKHKKETNGLNASCLILPFKEEEVPKNNVVKLFKT